MQGRGQRAGPWEVQASSRYRPSLGQSFSSCCSWVSPDLSPLLHSPCLPPSRLDLGQDSRLLLLLHWLDPGEMGVTAEARPSRRNSSLPYWAQSWGLSEDQGEALWGTTRAELPQDLSSVAWTGQQCPIKCQLGVDGLEREQPEARLSPGAQA